MCLQKGIQKQDLALGACGARHKMSPLSIKIELKEIIMKSIYLDLEVLVQPNSTTTGFDLETEVTRGSKEAVKTIMELCGLDVWVVCRDVFDRKVIHTWLANNFPFLKDRLLFLAPHSVVKGDVLITLQNQNFEFNGTVIVFDHRNPLTDWRRCTRLISDVSPNSMKLGVYCSGYSVFLVNHSNTAIKQISLATSRNEFCDEGVAIIESNDKVFENIQPKGDVQIYDNNMFRHVILDIKSVEWMDGQARENLTISTYDKD